MRPTLDVSVHRDGEQAFLALVGEASFGTCHIIATAVAEALESPVRTLYMDLSEVGLCDRAAGDAFAALRKLAEKEGKRVHLINPSPKIAVLFGADRSCLHDRVLLPSSLQPAPHPQGGVARQERAAE